MLFERVNYTVNRRASIALQRIRGVKMAKGINKVFLIGRLGADPELKKIKDFTVCNISIATTTNFKDKTGIWQDKAEWHRVALYDGLADIAGRYLKKGAEVYIEGKLRTTSWEEEGRKRYATDIVAKEMQMLGSKNSTQSNEGIDDDEPNWPNNANAINDEDIPF